jgi:hypothetical protein
MVYAYRIDPTMLISIRRTLSLAHSAAIIRTRVVSIEDMRPCRLVLTVCGVLYDTCWRSLEVGRVKGLPTMILAVLAPLGAASSIQCSRDDFGGVDGLTTRAYA